MEEPLKRRLVGAAVLASLAVIFVPMLIEERPAPPPDMPKIPPRPEVIPFSSKQLSAEVPRTVPRVEPKLQSPEPEAAAPIAQPQTGLTAWVVKVGSFSNKDNASRLVKKLRKAGFPTPDAEMVQVKGKTIYRVKVGPFLEKKRASQILSKVSSVAGVNAQVRRYP